MRTRVVSACLLFLWIIASTSCDRPREDLLQSETKESGDQQSPTDSPVAPTSESIRAELASHPSLGDEFIGFLSVVVSNGYTVIRYDKLGAARAEGPINTVHDMAYNEEAVQKKIQIVKDITQAIDGVKTVTIELK